MKKLYNIIAKEIEKETGHTIEELRSPLRNDDLVRSRMLFVYQAYRYNYFKGITLSSVGSFINRKYPTVINLRNKAYDLIGSYGREKDDFFAMRDRIDFLMSEQKMKDKILEVKKEFGDVLTDEQIVRIINLC